MYFNLFTFVGGLTAIHLEIIPLAALYPLKYILLSDIIERGANNVYGRGMGYIAASRGLFSSDINGLTPLKVNCS